jgi:hypothetical protein
MGKFYAGGDSEVAKESANTAETFKKGGKCMKKGGKAVMSKAARPARKSGGAVLSSASAGTPRGKASHY